MTPAPSEHSSAPVRRLHADLPAVAYASGNLGKVLLWSTTELALLFLLTEVIGLEAGLAGTLLLVTLLADILFDLLAGRIAAGAGSAGLSYAALVGIGTPVCAGGFAILFILPSVTAGSIPALAGGLLLFRAGYGLVDVAHSAMLPSVSTDSRARGRIAGYRSFFSAVAALLVTSTIAPAAASAARTGDMTEVARFGVAAALLFLACMALVILADRARPVAGHRPRVPTASGALPLLPRITGSLGALLVIGLVAGSAIQMLGRTILYLSDYVFSMPGQAALLLTAAVLGQLAGIPIWTVITQRFEKRSALALSGLATVAAIFAFAAAPQSVRPLAAAVTGAATAGVLMIPWALLADVIDLDHHRDGERREPQSFAAYLIALKGGGGLGTLALGWALSLAGHGDPGAGQASVAGALQWIAYGTPAVGGLIIAIFASRLGVTHARHAAAASLVEMRASISGTGH